MMYSSTVTPYPIITAIMMVMIPNQAKNEKKTEKDAILFDWSFDT